MPKRIDIRPDATNANKGTERGRYMVETSLRETGAGRSILLDADGRIIAGNKTFEAATDIGLPVRIIETDGKELIAVQRVDLDLSDPTGTARKLAYYDNRASQVGLEWDVEQVLSDINAGVDLSHMFHDDELDKLLGSLLEYNTEATDSAAETDAAPLLLTRYDVPDAVWATDNDWGVPLLDINLQAQSFDQPWAVWGEVKRSATMRGTWLFYTQDYKFEQLWIDPAQVLNTQCVNAVEPNFSCFLNMPPAVALWQIYRKRWMSRWWQSQGIRIFVDLNVEPNHAELNRLGIPQGWKAFATRGESSRMGLLHNDYAIAQSIAGESVALLFLVYGGGKEVKAECQSNGWIWIPEKMDYRIGKV